MTAKVSRPYAKKRGGPPSVTTVLGILDKPGLPFAAANETASFALHHQDQWIDQPQAEAWDRLRKHHRGLWDGRAAIGNVIHAVNETWTGGEEADLEQIVETARAEKRIWADRTVDHIIAEVDPFLEGLARFWTDFGPVTISAEDVVRHNDRRNSYIGTRDWRARINGERWLLDLKSTAKDDTDERPDKGVYADTWRLQLAAYRFAEEVVLYDDKGNETGTKPNEKVDRCGIVHLLPDGRYVLYEMRAGIEEHNRFLQVRSVYEWVRKESKVPTPELVLPARKEGAA